MTSNRSMTKSKEMKTILNFVETNHPNLTGNVKQGFIDWIMIVLITKKQY